MTTLIIGGSSQLAFYIIKLTSEQIPSHTIYASFRSQNSYEQQKSQLNSINVSDSNLVPLFIEDLDTEYLIDFFEKHFITKVYYLPAINIPSNHTVKNLDNLFYKVHVKNSLALLQALKFFPKIKSIFTLSSKMFSNLKNEDRIININSVQDPDSLYGATKSECWENIKKYRNEFGISAHAAVLFNFESNYRLSEYRADFVIHKIADDLVKIKNKKAKTFSIQSFFDRADWSHAFDICNAVVNISNTFIPKDYVIGSGVGLSLAEITIEALKLIDDKFLEEYCIKLIGKDVVSKPCLVADNFEAKTILRYQKTKNISNVIYSSFVNGLTG
jgi:GDP-D-mannose dehydratase